MAFGKMPMQQIQLIVRISMNGELSRRERMEEREKTLS